MEFTNAFDIFADDPTTRGFKYFAFRPERLPIIEPFEFYECLGCYLLSGSLTIPFFTSLTYTHGIEHHLDYLHVIHPTSAWDWFFNTYHTADTHLPIYHSFYRRISTHDFANFLPGAPDHRIFYETLELIPGARRRICTTLCSPNSFSDYLASLTVVPENACLLEGAQFAHQQYPHYHAPVSGDLWSRGWH